MGPRGALITTPRAQLRRDAAARAMESQAQPTAPSSLSEADRFRLELEFVQALANPFYVKRASRTRRPAALQRCTHAISVSSLAPLGQT